MTKARLTEITVIQRLEHSFTTSHDVSLLIDSLQDNDDVTQSTSCPIYTFPSSRFLPLSYQYLTTLIVQSTLLNQSKNINKMSGITDGVKNFLKVSINEPRSSA